MTYKLNTGIHLNLPSLPPYITTVTKMQFATNLSVLFMNSVDPMGVLEVPCVAHAEPHTAHHRHGCRTRRTHGSRTATHHLPAAAGKATAPALPKAGCHPQFPCTLGAAAGPTGSWQGQAIPAVCQHLLNYDLQGLTSSSCILEINLIILQFDITLSRVNPVLIPQPSVCCRQKRKPELKIVRSSTNNSTKL